MKNWDCEITLERTVTAGAWLPIEGPRLPLVPSSPVLYSCISELPEATA